MKIFEVNSNKIVEEKKQNAEYVAKQIFKNCQPFLNDTEYLFYRGVGLNDKWAKIKVDKNRIPVDSSEELTDALDKVYSVIGSNISRRSCIFVTRSLKVAEDYNSAYVVFPIGDYEVLWNDNIKDAYKTFEEDDNSYNYWTANVDTRKAEEQFKDEEILSISYENWQAYCGCS